MVEIAKSAMAFAEWVPCILNAVKPWVSSEDIDRGAMWLNDVMVQLKDTNYGLVFVTKENQNKPWILFESGALSKGLNESRVFTVLVDLQVRDIDSGSPLKHLNHTALDKESILKLLKSINKQLGDNKVEEHILEMTFSALWPHLESKISDICSEEPSLDTPKRDDPDVLNDILDNVLIINKKLSRGSNDRDVIRAQHARILLNRLRELDLDDQEIYDVLNEITPHHWLSNQLHSLFSEAEPDD